jgi:hypothetical protein
LRKEASLPPQTHEVYRCVAGPEGSEVSRLVMKAYRDPVRAMGGNTQLKHIPEHVFCHASPSAVCVARNYLEIE